jgi:hypothetical protein
MDIQRRIDAFARLGLFLEQFSTSNERKKMNPEEQKFAEDLESLVSEVHIYNPWFTENNVRSALAAIASSLKKESLEEWMSRYILSMQEKKQSAVAVIMAGNIPMVGFHDMLCVLLSGNKFIGKLSSEDKLLLPFIAKVLIAIEPGFAEWIVFTEGQLKGIDAVIATGSNNSSRYFEYYFGKYPHIIRKNRNSAAVLTGTESIAELRLLGEDVFTYFGLGCRNVSKLFVPEGYDFDAFYKAMLLFKEVANNNKYANNYEYNRTVYLMSSDPTLLDNNFLLLKEDASYSSPVGVLYYEKYSDPGMLNERLKADREQIQCIVSGSNLIEGALTFGTAQHPGLADYADGMDTMEFLISL